MLVVTTGLLLNAYSEQEEFNRTVIGFSCQLHVLHLDNQTIYMYFTVERILKVKGLNHVYSVYTS